MFVGTDNRVFKSTAIGIGVIAALLAFFPSTLAAESTPTVAITNVGVPEGHSGFTIAKFTVTLSSASAAEVTVAYATNNNTAVAGLDYVGDSGTVRFAPGTVTQTIAVSIMGDTAPEASETFVVELSSPINAAIGVASGVGTIVDDDSATPAVPPVLPPPANTAVPTVAINSVSVAEGNSGSAVATFTVTMSPASAAEVTVAYATVNNTAVAGLDYVGDSGTVRFAPGTVTQTIAISIMGDTAATYEARFFANDAFSRLATSSAFTVQRPPSLMIDSATVQEGDSGSTFATFNVTLSPTSSTPVTVAYATGNGTALAGSDYVAASGTLTFAPGMATQTIAVSILGDTTWESTETFVVTLSSSTNAVIGTATAVGTIVNDDAAPPPTITASPSAVNPGDVLTVVVADGPGNATDWVSIAAVGAPSTSAVVWRYLGGGTGGTLQFVAPPALGTYEARFLLNDQFVIAATSNPIVVEDTRPPVISGVNRFGITSTRATFSWTTNEPSDSEVEYGETTAYGGFSTLDLSRVTAHTVVLTGLAPSTVYHFRVRSRDASGNLGVSADGTFTTAEGIPPSVAITSPAPGTVVSGTFIVTATAFDNVGVAGVEFRVDGLLIGTEDTSAPYAAAWDTTTASSNAPVLTAVARDAADNRATSPPVSVTVLSVTLAWNANTEADLSGYKIYVGRGPGIYSSQVDVGPATTYTVRGVAPGILYYFAVTAYNLGGYESDFSNEVNTTR